MANRLTQLSSIDLQLFYDVRDTVLAGTPDGRRYIDLYYTHNPEILGLLVNDLNLWDEGVATLETWQPNLQALVHGQGNAVTITAGQVKSITTFLDHVSASSSITLQQVISDELAARPLQGLIGLTVEQARAQWVGYGLFLPLIRR